MICPWQFVIFYASLFCNHAHTIIVSSPRICKAMENYQIRPVRFALFFKKPDSNILKKYIESIQKNNPLEKSGILDSKLLRSFAKSFSKNLQEGNRIKISNVKKLKRSGHDAVLFDVSIGKGVFRIYYRYEIIKNDDNSKIIVASIVSLDGTKSHLKDLCKM